jgi:hypothetical protein
MTTACQPKEDGPFCIPLIDMAVVKSAHICVIHWIIEDTPVRVNATGRDVQVLVANASAVIGKLWFARNDNLVLRHHVLKGVLGFSSLGQIQQSVPGRAPGVEHGVARCVVIDVAGPE